MKKFLQASLLVLLASGPACATEPLHDRIIIDGKTGLLLPEDECCWVELPRSEKLRAAKRAMGCSAIGGPVGNFKLEGDKLLLLSLYDCGGDVPLSQFYPERQGPIVANWINGRFRVEIDPLCRSSTGVELHRETLTLTVESGRVIASEKQTRDKSVCHAES